VEEALPVDPATAHPASRAPTDFEYDAVIIGSGIGGLTTATQMAAKGARVVVLEK
jgi:prolycopene isomerase